MLNKKILTPKEMKSYSASTQYIRYYRNERCLSQEYMATKLGISQSTYQKIEAGNVKITKERLAQIAFILERPLQDFEDRLSREIDNKDIETLKQIITVQAEEIHRLKALFSKTQAGRSSQKTK